MPELFEIERQLSMMLHGEEDHLTLAYKIQHEKFIHYKLTQVVLFLEELAQLLAQHPCLCRLDRAKNDRPDNRKRHRVGMASSKSRARKRRNVVWL